MTEAAGDLVLREDAGAVATLTLNRPEKSNALSDAMIEALAACIREVGADDGIHVVVLAARGRNFCAGHDLGEMRGVNGKPGLEALFARCSRMMMSIQACPQPVIARVQGAAVAAGCQLAASCDLAIAAEDARFGVSGINLGLFCATPSVALSRNVAPKQALDLLLTGRLIDAARAAEIGLITEAVPAAALDARVAETARLIAEKPQKAIRLGKELFHRQLGMERDEAYALAGERMAENMGFVETAALIRGFSERHAKS